MGMHDSLRFFGASAEQVRCAVGHLARGELQTKSLDCNTDDHYVLSWR
jgi:hypothetical protein